MKVHDGDDCESLIREELENGGIERIEDLVNVLREAHEDARGIIAECDRVARAIEKGKRYPAIIKELAEDIRDSADDGDEEPEWVTKVLGPAEE